MQKLSYSLDKSLRTPLYLQLYEQIKADIHCQRLNFAQRLPSKRRLCEYLQISQNTVESAYTQLQAEGYIESKTRRGFFVCFQAELDFNSAKIPPKVPHFQDLPKLKFDLDPNRIDSCHFPLQSWRKAARSCFYAQGRELLSLGDKQGDANLRQQIAHYLALSRGVNCDAQQIVIAAGVEGCLQQLILLFNRHIPQQSMIYAMESFGYPKVEKLLNLYEKEVVKLPVSEEEDWFDIEFLKRHKINIAYLTPSHLYPFGQVLSITRRQQLLDWANQAQDRYIIEDDYDSEFRYKGRPIPALQSLDFKHKVIYLGSFSKLLMPALRISFMVLPKPLLKAYQQYCEFFHSSVSRFEQQRLANFIQQGEFEKHIHRMRKIYRRKMELLCRLLAPYKDSIRYYGEHSGFYLLIEILHQPVSAAELCRRALAQGIKIHPVDYQDRKLFSLGFGDLSEQALRDAMATLLDLLLPSPKE
ncbi:GntR family transcriptional regulator [Mesocricetibacter intestinalis]|uniref:GntR family transcriptional regulator n=1 Tax=Mesocricetibacter intestinalis TaxID=1521930 RepID=A0A4R6V7Z7_9PAST|nr:PLP-dependent aminotransferase family protein [Mesocricetibacter intestinalis]TDQ57433.1 GntR family transcriptional regulator [Mesocricetibacter intestinalis]